MASDILDKSANVSNTNTLIPSSRNTFAISTYSSTTACLSKRLSLGIGPISAAIYTSLPHSLTACLALATAAFILALTSSKLHSRLTVLAANVLVLISFAPALIYSL